MKQLWAPWRLQYIKASRTEGCIFCSLPSEGRDREHGVLYQGRHAFVILNAFPYNSSHLMVVPRRHVARPDVLTADERLELFHLMTASMQAVTGEYRPEGFNVGMNLGRAAGAGIDDHLHIHVVPRWIGDTNFMPVVGEVKVLPEDLTATYDRLVGPLKVAAERDDPGRTRDD
ncbi:MAG TPA: HIT domain-containing protein [bacterium]|nr:HIT domain-containing protein [bacterium]